MAGKGKDRIKGILVGMLLPVFGLFLYFLFFGALQACADKDRLPKAFWKSAQVTCLPGELLNTLDIPVIRQFCKFGFDYGYWLADGGK
jgi:hypothetical protein